MIIHRAFYREAAISTLATMLVLTLLVTSQKAVVMLSGAAVGDIKATWVATLLFLDLILDFDLLMQLALFIGVLVTLNRWYRDSEMVVMNACGIGVFSILWPVMIFTLVFALVMAAMVTFVRPAAFNRIQEVKALSADRADLGVLVPGQFSSSDGYTYYLEKKGKKSRGPVFIRRADTEETYTVRADTASQAIEPRTGRRLLKLVNGAIYQGHPGSADYQVSRFEEYVFRLASSHSRDVVDEVEGMMLWQLPDYDDRVRGMTELQTRLGKPFMLFIFAGIAMLLSYTTPRSSHYQSLFIAVMVFFFYLTVLQYVRDLMKAGDAPMFSIWVVQAIAVILVYRLLLRRNRGLPLVGNLFGSKA